MEEEKQPIETVGLVQVDPPELPVDPYDVTFVDFSDDTYEYIRKYTTLNGPVDIENGIIDKLLVNSGTASTNTSTGALIVKGGVGIEQNLNIGGDSTIAGVTTITNTTNATNKDTGALVVEGGVGIEKDLYVGGSFTLLGIGTINNSTSSINTTTGAFQVIGGVGVGENLNVGGNVFVTGISTFVGNVDFRGGTNGNIIFGDTSGDNVVFNADVNSNIIPNITNTYDLGSTTQRWKDAYYGGTVTAALFSGSFSGSFADGSVTLPSITFTNDLNTGFWRPGEDILAASTGGVERLRITNTGVGIGTNALNPFDRFHVQGGNTLFSNVATVSNNLDIGPYVQIIGQGGPTGALDVYPGYNVECQSNIEYSACEVLMQKARVSGSGTKEVTLTGDSIGNVIGRAWSSTNGGQWENASYINFNINNPNITGSGNHPSADIVFYGRTSGNAGQYDATEMMRIHGNNGNLSVTGNITNGGFDFILGNTDQINRGNSGSSRALVKDFGGALILNYAGDFVGGTRVGGGNFSFNSGYGSAAVAYGCRAWVNFDGTGSSGANQPIRASGNVSTVFKISVGRYTITFGTAMPDANYSAIAEGNPGGSAQEWATSVVDLTTTSFIFNFGDNNNDTPFDAAIACAAVFR
jgi:hypothetical protein